MSSEAITQNDLREILSRTVGSVPSEYKKLLWTNPSPTSAFSAQTVTLDLSSYDEVEVWFNCWRNRPNTSQQIRVKKGTYAIATQGASTNTSSGINPFVVGSYIIVQDRPIYVTDTGVQFGTCTEGASNGTIYNSDGSMIPTYIYGIKYERVAPPQLDASDYVIEQGIDGNWRYRKWESGVIEAWYYASVPFTSATNQTIGYIPTAIQPFTTPLNLQINGTGNGFIGDLHHLWIANNEVFITPTTAGTYATSVYLCFKN